jgi:hypothetical protein
VRAFLAGRRRRPRSRSNGSSSTAVRSGLSGGNQTDSFPPRARLAARANRKKWFSRPSGAYQGQPRATVRGSEAGLPRPEPRNGALGPERKRLTPCKGVPTCRLRVLYAPPIFAYARPPIYGDVHHAMMVDIGIMHTLRCCICQYRQGVIMAPSPPRTLSFADAQGGGPGLSLVRPVGAQARHHVNRFSTPAKRVPPRGRLGRGSFCGQERRVPWSPWPPAPASSPAPRG